jgi:hypothetical protein
MTTFPIPRRWQIPEAAMHHSFVEMARDGARSCEGIAMWLGRHEGDTAIVTHIARLEGPGIRKGPDLLAISASLVNDLTDVAIEHKLTLIGQIHSHGPWHTTDLSEVDKRCGIAVPGFLSAVAPDYALRQGTTLDQCGLHVFLPPQGWVRLSREEVADRFSIINNVPVSVLVAGQR